MAFPPGLSINQKQSPARETNLAGQSRGNFDLKKQIITAYVGHRDQEGPIQVTPLLTEKLLDFCCFAIRHCLNYIIIVAVQLL